MKMHRGNWAGLRRKLKHIAMEIGQLPGLRLLARPLYRRLFQRPYQGGNHYYGVYQTYGQALADAPPTLPSTYDQEVSGRIYRSHLDHIKVSDYPAVHWLSRLLASGQRRIFDLGGHIGVSYYGFRRYVDYPADLHWLIHDVPAVLAAGREWATEHDPERRLAFTDSREAADGADVLFTAGALQYLDYTLPDLLRGLQRPPAHVLVNLVPMHPSRGYFTLQNIGFAICPYRVSAVPEFVAGMQALGYSIVDRWETFERHLEVPFAPDCDIDCYYGFYFARDPQAQAATSPARATRRVAMQPAAAGA
ncbi:methyltransferase, TIGR04325 family [Lysobacter koreensis]|uniref:Methyltransferase, TIGR04325 family n=1 Tax=Lysobacter koreensis TaxID=266122 RepID=A0ABW2YHN7_9GAMM